MTKFSRWARALFGVAVFVFAMTHLLGCQTSTSGTAHDGETAEAFNPARASLAVAYGTVMEGANQLTQRSSGDDVQAALKEVLDLERKYGDLLDRKSLEQARLEALRAQVHRLNAAADLSRIQGEWERMMTKLRPNVKNPQAERETLRKRDEAFRELDDKRIAAERAYRDAMTRLEMARMSVERTLQEEGSKVVRNGAA